MVVLDSAGNGYRDIILPLAVQDDVLARAVCVVAAFHLAQKAPQLQQAALAGHHAIVEKLRRDSLQLSPEQVFTPYTWATIMVLLVGDTITGADNYLYLVEMLTCLRRSPEIIRTLPLSLRRFFIQQVKMYARTHFRITAKANQIHLGLNCSASRCLMRQKVSISPSNRQTVTWSLCHILRYQQGQSTRPTCRLSEMPFATHAISIASVRSPL